jgi:hypothetical protein
VTDAIHRRFIEDRSMTHDGRRSASFLGCASPLSACGARMEIIRVLPRGPYVSEQLIFRCCVCEVAMTRAGDERNWR